MTAVGVSGGVDSAVAARLMQRAGRRVVGVFMKNWEEAEETGSQCRYEADRRSAQAVCRKLGVEMLEVDLVR